jgi:integrative and conjugative element protein (TIGR02256 family)
MYDRILILRSVLDSIRAEVKSAGKVETGGAMVGYEGHDNSLVVTHASGPGPRAKLSRMSVLIDGNHAHAFCSRIFRESNGRLDYVGDWHRHVGWSLASSEQDLEAMLTIAEAKCCSAKYPVSLIYRLRPQGVKAYALHDLKLVPVRVKWVERTPHGQCVR